MSIRRIFALYFKLKKYKKNANFSGSTTLVSTTGKATRAKQWGRTANSSFS